MKPVHYTVGAINKLQPQFRAMLGKLMIHMVQLDPITHTEQDWNYDIDGNTFTWKIRKNPARTILKHLDEAIPGSTTALTAVIYLNGSHYVMSTDFTDHEDPGTTITVEILDKITELFTSYVITRMVRRWYVEEGMQERIHDRADAGDWSYIHEHCEGHITGFYDTKGYSVIVESEGQTIAEDTHYNQFGKENPTNTNKEIYKRYLNEAICFLLAGEYIFKGRISAPII
ncbi:hypothetical protein OBP_037 [Pseudomonas phage OBP]|uniref:hypothetical protein n=1 Tax=Pseudomonas phage OBP TaxID=1124849 RepID=UPI000240D622|nr:hypothetical protein OBP_037 [Pseudomonas phage OBP]AEV89474.1 hypothetical protein OBP_037 [Pseudomonas phage OBP]